MNECSLVAVGDISFGGILGEKLQHSDPFDSVRRNIVSADISIGNLECVLSHSGRPTRTYTHLRGSPENAKLLKIFTIMSLANNHIMDFGVEGMNNTIDTLYRNGINTLGCGADYFEASRPLIIERKSTRFGFINFMWDEASVFTGLSWARNFRRPGPARYYEREILKRIREAQKQTDIVVALIHWGVEYISFPSPEQRALAEKLIDAGVDLIIGHHPHVIQGFQRYHKGVIFYSLGDFLFDPSISKARQGLMIRLSVVKNDIKLRKMFIVKMNEDFRLEDSKSREAILSNLKHNSIFLENCDSVAYKNFWFEHVSETFFDSYKSNVALIKNYGMRYLIPFFAGLASPHALKILAGYARKKVRKRLSTKSSERVGYEA